MISKVYDSNLTVTKRSVRRRKGLTRDQRPGKMRTKFSLEERNQVHINMVWKTKG